jgi:polyphosphate kinase 2 (PPK2 family)
MNPGRMLQREEGSAEGHKGRSHRDARKAKASRKHRQGTSSAEGEPLKRKEYDRKLKKLHAELVKLQLWVQHTGLKVCIVFEGRDGAGKGGTIKAITERVSPRVFRLVALPAPTEREKSEMYAQRYLSHLPAAGEVVIFDRSWYNRAGVERVMRFCTEEEMKAFPKVTPLVEQLMVNSGIILLKLVAYALFGTSRQLIVGPDARYFSSARGARMHQAGGIGHSPFGGGR